MGVNDRREVVAELVASGIESPAAIRDALKNRGIINEQTGKAYTRRTVVRDMEAIGNEPNTGSGVPDPSRKLSVVKETIGQQRRAYNIRYHDHLTRETVDQTQADHAFYDELRRGGIRGLEIAGNFGKVIASKTAGWCLGRPPQIKHENEILTQELNRWMANNLSDIIDYAENMVALGDYYFVINPDLSLTPIQPDTIEPIVPDDDYKTFIGWIVRERVNHPTAMDKWMLETNIYLPNRREQIKEFSGKETIPTVYPNLIGRLNLIAMHNNKQTNDVYGTPEIAPLVKTDKSLLYAYNEVLRAAIAGNIRIGRPTPVISFDDYEQMVHFMTNNAEQITREKYDEISGETDSVTDYYIDFDADQLMTLSGAKFSYEHPGEISRDTDTILDRLKLDMLTFLELPEFVLGGELTSSRSTAETQMEVFEQWVGKKRGQFQKWLKEAIKVAALFISAGTPGIGSVDVDEIELVWEPLTGKDGKLTFETIQWAYSLGLIDRKTALMLAPIDIEDVEGVLDAVDAENEARRQDREAEWRMVNRREELKLNQIDMDEARRVLQLEDGE